MTRNELNSEGLEKLFNSYNAAQAIIAVEEKSDDGDNKSSVQISYVTHSGRTGVDKPPEHLERTIIKELTRETEPDE